MHWAVTTKNGVLHFLEKNSQTWLKRMLQTNYFNVYRGLDNVMGDLQRISILYSANDRDKKRHGSFDIKGQG